MGRNINSSKLSKTFIFSKVSQITIFSTYFNIPIDIIKHCIKTGELICSPIREDNHPTCGFRYDDGKLRFKDFAGYFWGDCFDAVALIMTNLYKVPIDVSNGKDFIKILRHITLVFKNIFYGEEQDKNLINNINDTLLNIKKEKTNIEIVTRNWNINDKKYWEQFGIDIQFLNINFVYPVEQYYIDRKINPNPKYFYNTKDPCYAYYLGSDKYNNKNIKLYFPNRQKTSIKFITNCNHLEGIINLEKNNYDIIVITKSTKDRLSIGATIKRISSLYGEDFNKQIGIINIPHETYKLREIEYTWLTSKLNTDGIIISLMDNDRTGKLEALWLYKSYHITPILIPKKLNVKDFAELYSNYDSKYIIDLIVNTIKNIKPYERNYLSFKTDNKENYNVPF